MGWNQIQPQRPTPLLNKLPTESYAYFVHGWHCIPDNPQDVIATARYGVPVVAAVQHGNLFGVQFHPEKSQKTGLQILANFLEVAT
jgi:glutamine amidotransferase